MDLKKAIKILVNRAGFPVPSKIEENKWKFVRGHNHIEEMSSREIISLSRVWTSDNAQNTFFNQKVKHYGKRKNRRETRDLLNKEQFDKIPQAGRVKDEDIWNWD